MSELGSLRLDFTQKGKERKDEKGASLKASRRKENTQRRKESKETKASERIQKIL